MLTRSRLVELYKDLKDDSVLSVYLDIDQHDPAERDAWRRRLEREVGTARRKVEEEAGNGLADFDAAWGLLRHQLDEYGGFVPGRGWVGFATPSAVRYSEALPVPMPDLVRWEAGIRAAPYVRGLKQHRPVVVVLADRQQARVLLYRGGEVEEPEDLEADTFLGDLSDVGVRKRSVRASGVRGETSTDQAQRILEVSSERMWKALGRSVAEYASPDGWIVLGGTPETVGRLSDYLPDSASDRVIERPSLHLGMSHAEVKEAAEEAASELSRRYQAGHVEEVVDAALAGGRAVLGLDATVKALREMRVDRLLVTRAFRESRPDLADQAVGTALLQDADIEEVAGEGSERLEREGGGIGARLRYRLDGDESG